MPYQLGEAEVLRDPIGKDVKIVTASNCQPVDSKPLMPFLRPDYLESQGSGRGKQCFHILPCSADNIDIHGLCEFLREKADVTGKQTI